MIRNSKMDEGNSYKEETVEIEASLEDDQGDEVDEEVVKVLMESSEKVKAVERVDLSGRQLKFLPEAFGKLHALIVLHLSHNQLEVS